MYMETSALELRQQYMQLSRQLLLAIEEGGPSDELEMLQQRIKALEPLIDEMDPTRSPDCP